METNIKASTSHNKSDSSDEDDGPHKNFSTEELCLKIKTFRNLCLENKINVNNAFDIDMIGYFYSWLEKKKNSIFEETTFQEISDYLEASTKIYAYRVDNLTETTSKLVEQFKSNNPSYSTTRIEDDNNTTAVQKPKRQKMMLTTPEKLRRTPNENENNTFNPALINHVVSSFSVNELLSMGSPSRYLRSLYSNESLAEEMKKFRERNDKKVENYETIKVDKSFLQLSELLSRGAICPEFKGFIAERDKVDNSNNDQLNGIEYHFDPSNHQFMNNSEDSICDEPDNNILDSNDKDTSVLDGLLECIDNVDRDYSFFNPKLLANWKGPKAWKAQAMAKALKSCTPNERKDISYNLNINDNIDESSQQNIKQTKTYKKRNQVKNDNVKIDWLDMSQIDTLLKKNDQDRKYISPYTLQKWDSLINISDTRAIVADITYKFNFLKYTEIKPDWWISLKNLEEDSDSVSSNSYQNSNVCSQTIVDTLEEAMEIDYRVSEKIENKNHENIVDKLANMDVSGELNPEDENVIADIKTESKMDIRELKKEISDIIDEQCVETNTNGEWSSKLSFFNLLTMLRVTERDGLSIPIVFVGLLHLANERGLKLFQEHCIINDMEETFIAKPINKE